MPVLCFPSADTLRLALASGVVPAWAALAPVRAGADDRGRPWVEVPPEFPPDILAALGRLGAAAHGPGSGPPLRDLSRWAELVPLRPEPPAAGPLLIEVPDAHLVRLAAQLRRVREQPLPVRLLPGSGRAWLFVREPPLPTVLNLDPALGAEAFSQQAPRVWVSAGWRHPLVDHLARPPGSVVLLRPGRDWEVVPDGPFHTEPEWFPVRRPAPAPAGADPEAFAAPLRLRRTGRESDAPERLWVLTGDPTERLGELARDTDERALHRFRVAVLLREAGESRTLILAPSGKPRPPVLLPVPRGFVPHERLRNLYLPAGYRLVPDLRPHALAGLLGLRPELLTWLEPAEGGAFVVHRTAAEFRPADEWVSYHAAAARPLSAGRTPSDLLALPRFVAEPERNTPAPRPSALPPSRPRTPPRPPGPEPEGWLGRLRGRLFPAKPKSARVPTPRARPEPPAAEPPDRVSEKLASAGALLHGSEWSARRAALEQRVLTDLPRLAPPERARVWAELADVYAAVGNPADAAVCWLNAAWDGDPPPRPWLADWLRCEARAARLPGDGRQLDAALAALPSSHTARVVAAHLAWAAGDPAPPAALLERLPRALALLDRHEAEVPARGVWLARTAAARLAEGDALGLARCRDRLFARLTEKGTGLDLDAPSFLRFRGATGGERWQTAREWLGRLREPVQRWLGRLATPGRLQWAGIDPEAGCTAAYADLILAWGLSRLGDRTRAKELEGHADAALARPTAAGADPVVHRVLRTAFDARIRAAQDGLPDRPGLPLEAAADLVRLDDLGRYAVEKLRAHCGVLEPIDLVNPYRGRDLGGFLGTDPLGERLTRLLARPDLAPDRPVVRDLLAEVEADPTAATLPRVVFALLQVAPRLDPAAAAAVIPHAARAVELTPEWVRLGHTGIEPAAAVERFGVRLLAAAAHAAGLFHLADSFRLVAEAVRASADSPDAPAVRALGQTAGRFFRTLRRLGLGNSAAELLAAVPERLPPGPRELGLAVGHFAAGREDAANRILDAARERLYPPRGISDVRHRTAVAVAYAAALGHAPPGIALGRLEELFLRLDGVSVHGAANRYYTLKPLELIDTVVRAVVSDDFALGPGVRGWLDDDEYLIRRRVNRDLEAALAGA